MSEKSARLASLLANSPPEKDGEFRGEFSADILLRAFTRAAGPQLPFWRLDIQNRPKEATRNGRLKASFHLLPKPVLARRVVRPLGLNRRIRIRNSFPGHVSPRWVGRRWGGRCRRLFRRPFRQRLRRLPAELPARERSRWRLRPPAGATTQASERATPGPLGAHAGHRLARLIVVPVRLRDRPEPGISGVEWRFRNVL